MDSHLQRRHIARAVSSGDGASFPRFWSVPASWGEGTLELRTPDCWARWSYTQHADKDRDVQATHTGPASRACLYVPEGGGHLACEVVEGLLNTSDASARADGTPLSSWATTVETVQTAASASTMGAIARFYPGVTPAELYARQAPIVWLGNGDVTAANGALELPASDNQSPDLAAAVAADVGFAPGHCNRIALWASANTVLKVYGPNGALVGTSTAAVYHELALSPWDRINLEAAAGADWRAHLWRE